MTGQLSLAPSLQAVATGDQIRAFDYSAIPMDTARAVQSARDRIRAAHRSTIIECGKLLNEVKASLPHGQFMPWCEAELGFSSSTANNYMRAASVFADKFATVANLPPGALYVAAAAPVEVRDDIVRRTDAGERLSCDDVKNMVAMHRADRRAENVKEAQKLKRQRAAQNRAEGRHHKQMEQWRREDEERAKRRERAANELIYGLSLGFERDDIVKFIDLFDEAGKAAAQDALGRLSATADNGADV